jgi:hypothetical protein
MINLHSPFLMRDVFLDGEVLIYPVDCCLYPPAAFIYTDNVGYWPFARVAEAT